jgi:amidase
VPLFVSQDDVIEIDTRTNEYKKIVRNLALSSDRGQTNHEDGMDRRDFVRIGVAAGAAAGGGRVLAAPSTTTAKLGNGGILDAGVWEQQQMMEAGKLTSHSLTSQYLARIKTIDKSGPRLNAIIEINPEALKIALDMDRERKLRRVRGPLHGIPVLLKDNIATADRMSTSAGSLALAGVRAARDAHVTAQLRAAGAVIIGKTNLSEWANMRSTHSVSGWSGRGGLTLNPYSLDRNCSGSSSGSGAAIAAGLATLAVGTETDGSIVSPASICGLVGIKPTLGLVSRSGIIPIAHSQDTAGPMARSVADAALMLSVMTGVDPGTRLRRMAPGKVGDYRAALQPGGLKGMRGSAWRAISSVATTNLDAVIEKALADLKAQGAVLVETEVPNVGKYDDSETEVLLYEFKSDLAAYLKEYAPNAPVARTWPT